MILSIIVGIGKKNEIGRANDLLWRLSADLKRFRELTTGHAIVMGRKTFDSLPKGALPNRTNVVISRNKEFTAENCLVFQSIDAALVKLRDEEEVFIIGGAQIYEQTLDIANKLYLTKVHAEFPNADTFFPELSRKEWKEVHRELILSDEKNEFSFTFCELERI